ncbi:MAG: glycosyltransferase [Candidatus Aenigmatarchaeota archaeon]
MLSLILPIYNQACELKKNFTRIVTELEKAKKSRKIPYEILIVEESIDSTPEIAQQLEKKYPFVRHFHSDIRLGKGGAIMLGIRKAKGELVAFTDIDLAADIAELPKFIDALKNNDIAVGLRIAKRSLHRKLLGSAYVALCRLMFGIPVRDLQCGFKVFRRSAVVPLLPRIKTASFVWDTEFLLRATQAGLRIAEIPVAWQETSKLTKAHMRMPLELIWLWLSDS